LLSEHIFAGARAAIFIARTAQSADAMLRQAEKTARQQFACVEHLNNKAEALSAGAIILYLTDGQKIDAHFSCAQRYVCMKYDGRATSFETRLSV
jgi:hypothetical protein